MRCWLIKYFHLNFKSILQTFKLKLPKLTGWQKDRYLLRHFSNRTSIDIFTTTNLVRCSLCCVLDSHKYVISTIDAVEPQIEKKNNFVLRMFCKLSTREIQLRRPQKSKNQMKYYTLTTSLCQSKVNLFGLVIYAAHNMAWSVYEVNEKEEAKTRDQCQFGNRR